jgi:hypothetical protein
MNDRTVQTVVDQSMTEQADPYGDTALHERIDWNMTNHAPINDDVIARFEALRTLAKSYSHGIVDLCPPGRDRELALERAEDSLMRAVAAIARDQQTPVAAQETDSLWEPEPELVARQRAEDSEMAGVAEDLGIPFETSEDLEKVAEAALGRDTEMTPGAAKFINDLAADNPRAEQVRPSEERD